MNKIKDYLYINEILVKEQYAFRAGHSTIDAHRLKGSSGSIIFHFENAFEKMSL